MILHIVNQSPFQHSALQQCLRALGQNDSILLIEDGVLLMSNPGKFTSLPPSANLFVLGADCKARGITINTSVGTEVDYDRFVELTTQHTKTISWF